MFCGVTTMGSGTQGRRWNVNWGGGGVRIHVLPDEFLFKSNSNSSI